jgi:hypothetical protein
MQEFHSRIGIDRKQSSYLQYVNTRKHLKHFLKEKYSVRNIPLSQLNLPFIEDFDFYLRVDRKLKSSSINENGVKITPVNGNVWLSEWQIAELFASL